MWISLGLPNYDGRRCYAYNIQMLVRAMRRWASTLKTFENLEQLNTHLNTTRPNHYVMYFRATWNPQCVETDQHAVKLAASNPNVEVIKVDTDTGPKIATHYSVRAEPEFVFCLYGDEVLRQIGPNYENLQKKIDMMKELAKAEDMSGVQNVWTPYGQRYKAYEHLMIEP